MSLAESLNTASYTGLTLYPTTGGKWQASMRNQHNGWKIAVAGTPAEAMAAVLNVKPKIEDLF